MRTLEEDRTPEQDMNEQDDMSEQDSPDPEPAAPPPLPPPPPPPPPPPQSRIHSTHAQKGDDLQKLMDDTNKRVAALPVMPRAAAHAPAPLFHQAEPAAQQPEPAAVQTGASKPRQRKPVKPRTKQPAKRRDSDESTISLQAMIQVRKMPRVTARTNRSMRRSRSSHTVRTGGASSTS